MRSHRDTRGSHGAITRTELPTTREANEKSECEKPGMGNGGNAQDKGNSACLCPETRNTITTRQALLFPSTMSDFMMKMPRRLWLELTCLNEHVTRDPQRSMRSWNIKRRHSEMASSTQIGDHKILSMSSQLTPPTVYETLHVAVQWKVCSWLEEMVFDELNEAAIDFTTMT